MKDSKYYKVYSEYLKEKYGEKVYKLPISLNTTCPNRDGNLSKGGCIFCGAEGGSFENLPVEISIKNQLKNNKNHISKKYNAKKFIAYFQNFTNTYLDIKSFEKVINEAIIDDIVGISISTRPDCISEEYLKILKEVSYSHKLDIDIELGLQSVNYHTLKKINRGHGLAEFIDSVIKIKRYDFNICTHMILNLPWDDEIDIIEGARILSSLGINQIKLHSLYIVKNTILGEMYKEKKVDLITKKEYIDRVIKFLENLSPEIVIQRLIGRAPEEDTLFVNWNTSWWKIKDEILEEMEIRKTFQGKKFDYLNGKALKKFTEMI